MSARPIRTPAETIPSTPGSVPLPARVEALDDRDLLGHLLWRTPDPARAAEDLLSRFGSLAAVLSADTSELALSGLADQSAVHDLQVLRELAIRMARIDASRRPVVSSWTALQAYVRTALAHRPREQFRVLYLDHRNHLMRDEMVAEGTVDHAPVYPREVVRRALELSASAMILVHNHPTRSIRSRWSTHKHAETLANSGIFGIA